MSGAGLSGWPERKKLARRTRGGLFVDTRRVERNKSMKISIPKPFLFQQGRRQMKEPAEAECMCVLTEESDFYIKEAYKSLRTNVTFALMEEENCKTIIVTSAMQSEGKSVTAANLAISYAAMNCRVLLIDCDLRRPKLARLLSVSAPVGLSNLLIKPELREQAVINGGMPNLSVILSGDIPPNPSELLASNRMKRLLERLRGEYEYIILDTPPVNTVTDACVLSPESSGVLFVVRAGITERGSVERAVSQLEYAKAKFLGFVINDASLEKDLYGYGKYRYGRYGKYGYGKYGYGYRSYRASDEENRKKGGGNQVDGS